MKYLGILYLVVMLHAGAIANAGDILRIDLRERPPFMLTDGEQYSGPFVDILKEAAGSIGYQTKFQKRQVSGSFRILEAGDIDIIPRIRLTKKRAERFEFIGPIGYEHLEMTFLVKKSRGITIQHFKDLEKHTIGVKKGTAYSKKFDTSTTLRKMVVHGDDDNLVQMLLRERFDVMIVLEPKAVIAALEKYGIRDYAFTDYRMIQKLWCYFIMTKNHPLKNKLQQSLEKMVRTGRIQAIMNRYNLNKVFFTDKTIAFGLFFEDY